MIHYRWLLVVAVLVALLVGCSREPSGISLEQMRQQTHIHGLAFDRSDSERVWLATHHGFYAIGRDGMVRRVSDEAHDFMGFALHPEEAETFFASGHPARGGNLGVVMSTDGGRSWSRHASGVDGPVDFHQLTISAASPDTLYGAYAGQLQVSQDGGASWQIRARAPAGLLALAASSRDPEQLYAATQSGLLMSPDGGERWRQIHPERRPVSLVVIHDGQLYAFMLDVGLLHAEEGSRDWEMLKRGWGDRYLLHLAVDPSDPQRLIAADDLNQLLISDNGGRDWSRLE
ncbi:WD40/YVTN/BNR-like repeat-containing protein [Halomonas urumqiensis]|uniref:Exo-alpha-sialidase n=1 Tax=Halomonas urumqiensis TaxID=1684789 RepID=A0A2N7UF98_9GAMM|nr:hypothetical protein [Halomonas urumqiensis]PMR79116.1 hypothetical protein C1H70_12470 [Halomonas urumqiensis]PTB03790.1 hypothetical protein C6V82_04755 [Halomonas urumqiensis]GHE19980.1 hypothetical protein GCM10017767_05010 [Halomonas urumqiensis]